MSSLSLQPILALVGYPLSGNPTQYMLHKAFAHHDLEWRYLSVEVMPDDLGDAVRGIRAMGFSGGNCTDPHRSSIIEHLDRVGNTAARVGAVNLMWREDEHLVGENTEGQALLEAIGRQINPTDKRIVLLGTGRIARAAVVELSKAGVGEIVVVAPEEDDVRQLLDLVEGDETETVVSAGNWEEQYRVPEGTDVLINAVSGEQFDPEASPPLDLDTLGSSTIVADVTLDPPRTQLLREAAERGCATLDGLELFVTEAAINFRVWTGVDPAQTVLREAVEEFLEL